MMRIIQYGLSITLGVVFSFTQLSPDFVNSFCLILILIFGIPHGAVDHRIHISTTSDTSVTKYVLRYLLIAAGYVLWWLLDPAKALLMFIILSAYHFGQELLEDVEIKESSVLTRMIWGSVILIAPMIYHLADISAYLNIVVQGSIPSLGKWKFILVGLIILSAIGSVISMHQKGVINQKLIRLVMFLLFIIVSHTFISFVFAFTLYFVFFHSLNAFKHQFKWLKSNANNFNLGNFIMDLIGFSLLAILGIVGLIWFLKPESQISLITYFFILVSLITLPHAITLDQFYRFRNKRLLSTELK